MSATGPFIVTHQSGGACEACGGPDRTGIRHCRDCDGPLYREAFATLEEARVEVADRAGRAGRRGSVLVDVFRAIGEQGGTITLPNGDVIEVEAMERQFAIWASRSRNSGRSREEWCAAWNAEHGIGLCICGSFAPKAGCPVHDGSAAPTPATRERDR